MRQIFSQSCKYELVSWAWKCSGLLIFAKLAWSLVSCQNISVFVADNENCWLFYLPFLEISLWRLYSQFPSIQSAQWDISKFSDGALRVGSVDRTTICPLPSHFLFPAWTHNLMAGAPAATLDDEANLIMETIHQEWKRRKRLHPWWHRKSNIPVQTAYFCTSYCMREK